MADLAGKAKEEARRAKHEAEIRATRETWEAYQRRVTGTVPDARAALATAKATFEAAAKAVGTSTDRAGAMTAYQEAEQAYRAARIALDVAIRTWGPEKAPLAPGAV